MLELSQSWTRNGFKLRRHKPRSLTDLILITSAFLPRTFTTKQTLTDDNVVAREKEQHEVGKSRTGPYDFPPSAICGRPPPRAQTTISNFNPHNDPRKIRARRFVDQLQRREIIARVHPRPADDSDIYWAPSSAISGQPRIMKGGVGWQPWIRYFTVLGASFLPSAVSPRWQPALPHIMNDRLKDTGAGASHDSGPAGTTQSAVQC
ncbi:hypothetical protein B0H11DRAFT_236310 [Mycena galericulata]|nr:hypothetical protein B0H11DRAFT_236310 [Mycena galericulata]